MPTHTVTDAPPVRHVVSAVKAVANGVRILGYAHLTDGETRRAGFQAILRSASEDREFRLPASRIPTPRAGTEQETEQLPTADCGFDTVVHAGLAADGSALPAGAWEVWVALTVAGRTSEFPLTSRRSDVLAASLARPVSVGTDGACFTVAFAESTHRLTLEVGTRESSAPDLASRAAASWAPGRRPVLLLEMRDAPDGLEAADLVLRAVRSDARVLEAAARTEGPDRALRASLPLTTSGTWRLVLAHRHAGVITELPVPRPGALTAKRWWHRGVPWYAKPVGPATALSVRVSRMHATQAIRRRLRL